jgi:hypothetical protein
VVHNSMTGLIGGTLGKNAAFCMLQRRQVNSQHSILGTRYTGLAVVTAAFKRVIEQLTVLMCGSSRQAHMDGSLPAA